MIGSDGPGADAVNTSGLDPVRLTSKDLAVRFGAFAAVQRITLSLAAGQYAILVGPNGAGKSTLLKALGGWIRPTDGSVSIDGMAFDRHERVLRSRVKLVPDTPAFYPDLTAWEHLQVAASAHRIRPWRQEAEELLSLFDIASHQNAYPGSFSRGMQYKLALAMSLLTHPAVLLLDEPFGPLDPAAQMSLAARIRRFADDGTTVLASTHLLPPAHPPDRVLVLRDGILRRDAVVADVWTEGSDGLAALPHRMLTDLALAGPGPDA